MNGSGGANSTNSTIAPVTATPDRTNITVTPDPNNNTNAPNATNVTVTPDPSNVTNAPNVSNVTTTPDPNKVTNAPIGTNVPVTPNITTTANMTSSPSPCTTTPSTTTSGICRCDRKKRNGEYANENAPPSSRMDLMIYDCATEQHAFNHVRACSGGGSIPIARPGYDENIHVLRTTATDDLGAIQNAFATWIIELTGHGIPSDMVFAPHVAFRQSGIVNHVSKILWGTNRRVGCATIRCSTFYFTQCFYQNPVNIVGASIYQIGAVCSACPVGIRNCTLQVGCAPGSSE